MFDDIFENKMVGASIITSAIAVILITGCCCVKNRVYSNPKVKRERLGSQAIPSEKSAFKVVRPRTSSIKNVLK